MDTVIAAATFLLAGLLGRLRPDTALYVVAALIPTYIYRLQLLGFLPTNFVEILIVGAAVGILSATRPRLPQLNAAEKIGLVLVVVGLVAGVMVAPDRLVALGIVKGWFLFPALFGWLIWLRLSPKQLPRLLFSLVLGSLPLSLSALYQVTTQHFITTDGRASAWFSSPNYLSLYLAPLCILCLGVVADTKTRAVRALAATAGLLAVAAILASQSLSSAVAVMVAAGIFFIARGWRPTKAAFAGVPFIWQRLAGLADLGERSSASVRLQVWKTAALMIKENWLTGTGLGSFTRLYTNQVQRVANPPLEYSMLHSHNLALETWLSLGLPGLVGGAVLVVQWLWLGAKILGSGIGASLFAALCAILLNGVTDLPYFKNDLALVFWIIIASIYVQATSLQHRD